MQLCEEYARLDAEKNYNNTIGPNERIVYDRLDFPPPRKNPDGTIEAPYIDENDLVEIT